MADTQRFAIWRPSSMATEAKKPAPVPIIQEQPQVLNKNIENLVKDFKWNDGLGGAKPSPIPTSRSRIQSVSSYTRPNVAPQPIHLGAHLSKTNEDDSESTSEEDVSKVPPVMARKFSSSSPPKPILSSTPVNSNLSNGRPRPTEKVPFALSKVGRSVIRSPRFILNGGIQETAKENEGNLAPARSKPTEKPANQGPKVLTGFSSNAELVA